ncbi:MAG: FHA domain-containing protein [Planctomycetota bacterium]
MMTVTLKVLHGADRGKVFESLVPPFTVGREEGNNIQLNDERVSRCHFKVQRDNDRLVLTDLDSTNGTKVNGIESQLKILRHGDLIAVGRSLMLVGSESQIAARLASMGGDDATMNRNASEEFSASGLMSPGDSFSAEGVSGESPSMTPDPILLGELPPLPSDLTPGQRAQICELIDHLQNRIFRLIETSRTDENTKEVKLKFDAWQRLIATQAKLAEVSRNIAEP